MKRALVFFVVFSVLTVFCLIGVVYASGPVDTVVNGIGDLFAQIIEAITEIFFSILDFLGNLIFGI